MLKFAFIYLGILMFSNSAMASTTGLLSKPLTLRQMSPDEDFLMLADDLVETDFQLPEGSVISYTPGNTLPKYAFEDDKQPGEVHESSNYPFQQNIRIDKLPGYSEEVRGSLNKKRIFISEPQLRFVKSYYQPTYHKCTSTLIQKAQRDSKLSEQVKRNFPRVLSETLDAYNDYASSVRQDYIAFIDYSVPSSHRRFFLVNLKDCEYLSEFVAHGSGLSGSGGSRSMLKRCATGRPGASTRKNRTRDGIYKISTWHWSLKRWPVVKKIKGIPYKGLKLESLDGKHKDVLSNGVVMHEASYVFNNDQIQGRSNGCPAFAKGHLKKNADRLLGSILNIYAPQCR